MVAAQAKSFVLAYERLVEELEQALWYDDAGNVVDAYQEYTDAYGEALADPMVYQRVAGALQRLTEALTRALERTETRSLVEEAVHRYLDEVGAAWPQLRGESRELDSFVAVATGMATLAWLHGFGSSGLVSPFGATELFPTTAAGPAWGSATGSDGRNAGPNGGGTWDEAEPDADPAADGPVEDDDGIVWQELAVGDDGQIVQRSAPPPPGPGTRPRSGGGERAAAAENQPRAAAAGSDPVALVERAYAAYVEGLRAAGAPVAPPEPAEPGAPTLGAPAAVARADLGQRSAELTAAYLRLAQGVGSVPDLYLTYARFLGSATELVDRELALVRSYERLVTTALQGTRPAQIRQAADAHYRRFVAAVREAWAQIDPGRLPPERLATLTETTARAAALHDAAATMTQRQPPG